MYSDLTLLVSLCDGVTPHKEYTLGVVAEVMLLPALTVLWLRERGSHGSSKSLQGLWEGDRLPLPGRSSCSECWREAIRLSFSTGPFACAIFLGTLRRESVLEGGRGGFFAFFKEIFRER